MANNLTLSAGTADGAVIATDDIGGVHYPYTKIGIGADDTFTILVGGAGAVAAGVQRVTLASDDPAVTDLAAIEVLLTTQAGYLDGIETLIGTTNTNTGNAATSLSVLDDWDNTASDGVSVSGDVAHDAVDAGEPVKIGGYAKAAAPTDVSADGDRVNAWFDLAGRLQVGDGGGSLTVDGTVAVTNAGITTIAGAVSGTEMQVDVLTSALPTGAATAAKQPALGTAGTASSDVITVQGIASMTALKVDGSGVTQPVSNAGITTIAGAVSGTEMQVDVVGALPAGTNAIGKLAANSGVDIGDVDVTSISAGTNAIGNVGLVPRTTGGMTIFNSIDLDETEEEIKASAGQVFSISAFNTTAAPLYLRFYNATAANTTVGTTAAHMGPFLVPGNADSDGAGFVWNNEIGAAFGTAISAAVTTGVAANDTGAPGANACIVVVGYA
jgi:hypothetical protein